LKLPGFIRFDAAVYARITENWKARLNVENIFNKHYWASADGNNNISRGRGAPFASRHSSTFKPGSASDATDSARREFPGGVTI
jgi:outer membrane receptor protein involved in Fe transport